VESIVDSVMAEGSPIRVSTQSPAKGVVQMHWKGKPSWELMRPNHRMHLVQLVSGEIFSLYGLTSSKGRPGGRTQVDPKGVPSPPLEPRPCRPPSRDLQFASGKWFREGPEKPGSA
jgi:hypothetical protein